MKYAILLSVTGALAFFAGCSSDPKSGETGGNGGAGTSSSSSGDGGASSSSSSSSGGGGGAGGSGGSSSSSSSSSSSGAGGGKPVVCDNPQVVDKVDSTMRCTGAADDMVKDTVMAPANMVWADKVEPNGYSSQYSPTDYSAMQATGAPDVYPSAADEKLAWASQTTDDQDEFITVGFSNPVIAESVWVFETHSPGAVSKITITAADGDHVVYTNAAVKPIGACAHVVSVSTKTCSPISKVRVDVASKTIPDYNEIDAIGLVPAPPP